MIDYYKTLEIQNTATSEEIKLAYRRLAQVYHPDKNLTDIYNDVKFKEITEAYNTLSDSEARTNYDFKLNKYNIDNDVKAKSFNANSPTVILEELVSLWKYIDGTVEKKIGQIALVSGLLEILNVNNIDLLIEKNEININKSIIELTVVYTNRLKPDDAKFFLGKIKRLESSNLELNNYSYKKQKEIQIKNYWNKYRSWYLLGAVLLILIFVFSDGDKKRPIYKHRSRSNGDLNNTFINSEPILTKEDILKKEKDSLLQDGWNIASIPNGQMQKCYNFAPKYDNINNKLSVSVGGGTDVTIKVMNHETDKCIRYVFINSGTFFEIKNIPEGKYYLKIAYGKEWYSKIINGNCQGKFIINSIYKRGNDIFDFNIKRSTDSYNIPSYKLQLDVIDTDHENSYNSESISEIEFNK